MPGLTPAETTAFVQPLLQQLNELGIPAAVATPNTFVYSSQKGNTWSPGNPRFASRLFPRAAYEDPKLFAATMAAARAMVEDGYTFHGLNMAPTLRVAGAPSTASPPGVNPVWRDAVMHADVFETTDMSTITPSAFADVRARMRRHMDALRAATPGGGAYLNEADLLEPDWQTAFFGSNYPELLRIKRARDPWQLFWAPATVGSEGWAVQTPTDIPTQNGRLCRV